MSFSNPCQMQLKPGAFFMFVNGLQNSSFDAQNSADAIRSLLGVHANSISVDYYHNETNMAGYVASTFFNHGPEIERQNASAYQLSNVLQDKLQDRYNTYDSESVIYGVVFAHSHGAALTDVALNLIQQQYLKHLIIICYGGAKLVPKSKAVMIVNHIREKDHVSHLAVTLSSNDKSLATVFQRYSSLRIMGKTKQEAISSMATEHTIAAVIVQLMDDKSQPRNHSLKERLDYLSVVIDSYNVVVHPTLREDNPDCSSSTPEDGQDQADGTFWAALKKTAKAVGQSVAKEIRTAVQEHKFSTYMAQVSNDVSSMLSGSFPYQDH